MNAPKYLRHCQLAMFHSRPLLNAILGIQGVEIFKISCELSREKYLLKEIAKSLNGIPKNTLFSVTKNSS